MGIGPMPKVKRSSLMVVMGVDYFVLYNDSPKFEYALEAKAAPSRDAIATTYKSQIQF